MSREIKFRAWDTRQHEWTNLRMGESGIVDNSFPTYRPVVFNSEGKYVVMQYTGLKDKNGVEIYEGDLYITDGDRDDPYQVMFVSGAFVGGRSSTNCMPLGWDGEEEEWPWTDTTIEVIGNIYENKELLEEK